MPPKGKYTDPKLRDEVKEELKQSDKGGEPGQWSARKAQMMAQEYKKRGGGYTTDKSQQDESQKNLEKWNEEDWQTKEGSGNAKKEDGTQKRYLPKKAWEKMTEEEKKETDDKKQKESKKGKQHVENTKKAKNSRKQANEEEDEKFEAEKEEEQKNGDGDDGDDNDAGEEEEKEEEEAPKQKANTGEKRKSTRSQTSAASNKKQKQTKEGETGNAPPGKVGSKHMDAKEPGQRGSADRLPKKGQAVTWKAMPGYVEGKVKEVLTKGKKVDGKDVKASKDDPKLVLTSDKSGKICVHKPDACFYD